MIDLDRGAKKAEALNGMQLDRCRSCLGWELLAAEQSDPPPKCWLISSSMQGAPAPGTLNNSVLNTTISITSPGSLSQAQLTDICSVVVQSLGSQFPTVRSCTPTSQTASQPVTFGSRRLQQVFLYLLSPNLSKYPREPLRPPSLLQPCL